MPISFFLSFRIESAVFDYITKQFWFRPPPLPPKKPPLMLTIYTYLMVAKSNIHWKIYPYRKLGHCISASFKQER